LESAPMALPWAMVFLGFQPALSAQ
jgi:hypothetical protein